MILEKMNSSGFDFSQVRAMSGAGQVSLYRKVQFYCTSLIEYKVE